MNTAIITPDSNRTTAAAYWRRAGAGSAPAATRYARLASPTTKTATVPASRRRWDAPRIAFELTAAVADGDHAAIAETWKGLDSRGLADLIICLGAHARHAAWTATMLGGNSPVTPARQMMALYHLCRPPARDLAARALSDHPRPAAADPGAGPAMREAALGLAGVIVATLWDAGWPRPYIAVNRRRHAADCGPRGKSPGT
jgi:hypothetical protein